MIWRWADWAGFSAPVPGRAWWRAEVAHELTGSLLVLTAVVSVVMAAYLAIAAMRRARGPSGQPIPARFLWAQSAYKGTAVAGMYLALALSVFYGGEATPLWGAVLVVAAAGAALWLFWEWVRVTRGPRDGGGGEGGG